MIETDQQLATTIKNLYQNAPAFEQRMRKAGLTPTNIQSITDLHKLPILRKDDLIELQKQHPPFGGLLAVPISQLKRVYQSPGPINEPNASLDDAGRWSPGLVAAGFKAGDVVLNAFAYHMTPAGASLEDALRKVGCVVIPGGIGNQEQQIEAMISFGATGYVGLPSYLKALLDKAASLGKKVQLDHAFVLAEPLPPSLREELKQRGVSVLQAYGTAECGNLGYETAVLNGWHVPQGVIVQICDINTGEPLPHGETGEVVATLLNSHYAIVRFGVGDLSAIIPESATDGGPLRLAGWQGRVGAATKVRGMFLHPTQLAAMMKRFPEIDKYQAVITRQDHKDHLTLEATLDDNIELDKFALAERIQQTARDAIKFRLKVKFIFDNSLDNITSSVRDEREWK